MCRRVELRPLGGVLLHEVDRGRSDDARIILKRRVVRQVIETVSRAAARRLAEDMLLLRLIL